MKFGDLPTGVTLEPTSPVIKHGDTETRTAADDASHGNFSIKVTGHSDKGADASTEIKLTVVKE